MKTLAEAKIIARSSDPEWVGEELFRLQMRAADLESWLRYALDNWAPSGSDKAEAARRALESTPAHRSEQEQRQYIIECAQAGAITVGHAEELLAEFAPELPIPGSAPKPIDHQINDDVISIIETTGKLPRLVYLVHRIDAAGMQGVHVPSEQVTIITPGGMVDVWVDPFQDRGKLTRAYRCSCGDLYLDDSARMGKCQECRAEHKLNAIAMLNDDLRNGRMMLPPPGGWMIGIDPGFEPSRTSMVIGRVQDGVFHIEPDPPPLTPAGRCALVADLLREGKITSAQARQLLEMPGMDEQQLHRAMDLMLNPAVFVRDVDVAPAALRRIEAANERAIADLHDQITAALEPEPWPEARVRSMSNYLPPTPPSRADGFGQDRIDEIKAMMLATAKLS